MAKFQPGELEFLAGMLEARAAIADEHGWVLRAWFRKEIQAKALKRAFGGYISKMKVGYLWRLCGPRAILTLRRVMPYLLGFREDANRAIAEAIRRKQVRRFYPHK